MGTKAPAWAWASPINIHPVPGPPCPSGLSIPLRGTFVSVLFKLTHRNARAGPPAPRGHAA